MSLGTVAAGALSINIGKRPRDLLNPKAVKYMQAVFAIRDVITKKESREISARFGVKVTQEETFSGQAKLMKWILQIQTAAVLSWFLTKGGLMIIATWPSQAASEEQTSVLCVILEMKRIKESSAQRTTSITEGTFFAQM